jgi:hypothetical protein
MNLRDHLKPKLVVDPVAQRVGKRIAALEGTRMYEYSIAVHELRIVPDLLERASNYDVRGEGKEHTVERKA